jgi:hypothetical protein
MNIKSKLFISGTLFFSILFCGCFNDISLTERFIGNWETSDGLEIIFYDEESCKFLGTEGNWEIENDTILLILRFEDGKNTMSFEYKFSDDYKVLTLSYVIGTETEYIFTKI